VSGPRVAGKALPTAESMADTAERGFERAELHCPPWALEDVADTADTVRGAPLSVTSVHTPHVGPDDLDPIRAADRLARRLETTLVVHTQHLQHTRVPTVEALGLSADRAYENNPGASVRHLEATILDRGLDLVVDTAHLYMAHESYVDRLATLLDRYGDRIPVVHLTDATPQEDGLPFGEGDSDLAALGRVLKERYDGVVVLEVMPDHQRAALERFRAF
jgi:sugar phosphate isomerase/epimerase